MADRPPPVMPDRIDVRGIVVGAVAIAGAIVLALVVAAIVAHGDHGDSREGPRPPAVAGAVMLQADPRADITALRAQKQRLLSEYAWIDRERGIARIPIERAMALRSAGTRDR